MVTVTFADLTHVGVVVDANFSPLSVGYIAAYAQRHLGDSFDPKLFKYPNKLAKYLGENTPTIACFSDYMWNERLHLEFARRIKLRHPEVITIFGGPNYPINADEQQEFLEEREQIDFYVDGEGEAAFVELFTALNSVDFNAKALKENRTKLSNVHYLAGDTIVRGALLPRLRDLDDNLPSPYLTGLLDEFFDDKLQPLIQTARGCPYSCTFCHDGIDYMNKIYRFSQEYVREELQYIAERVQVPGITLADLNWGMFPDDLLTAETLAEFQRQKGWPVYIASATAKNQKERVVEMSRILGGSIHVGASIQSTDSDVLANIKRTNIGYDAIVKMAKASAESNAPSFSEVILCLPGDTKQKHFKSMCDMLDAGIQEIRSYQFILLPGTEAASEKSQKDYEYETRFRVLPRCFGRYELYGEELPVAEIHEVTVGHNTMSLSDYLECRDFNLSLEIFSNGNLFDEIWGLAEVLGIPKSELILKFHEAAVTPGGELEDLYRRFREDEARNFFKSKKDLEEFLSQPEGFNAYISGEYGANQIFTYRSIAVFELLEKATDVALNAFRAELRRRSLMQPILEQYLDELKDLILARKSQIMELDRTVRLPVHFDFAALEERKHLLDPSDVYEPDGLEILVQHSDSQVEYLKSYFRQYKANMDGLIYFIHRQPAHLLYRQVSRAGLEPQL